MTRRRETYADDCVVLLGQDAVPISLCDDGQRLRRVQNEFLVLLAGKKVEQLGEMCESSVVISYEESTAELQVKKRGWGCRQRG